MSDANVTSDYNIGIDNINIKSSTVVKLYEYLSVFTEEGPFDLKIEIIGDLELIPEKYHEVFMNVMTSRYLGKVSFGNNPFSECKPLVKRKWWQFWKSKYFIQS
jgi:hypothetical protein